MAKKVKKKALRGKSSEKVIEQEALREEGFSILVVLSLTVLFVVLGIVLGYYIYKLALSSSGVVISYSNLLN